MHTFKSAVLNTHPSFRIRRNGFLSHTRSRGNTPDFRSTPRPPPRAPRETHLHGLQQPLHSLKGQEGQIVKAFGDFGRTTLENQG